MPCASVPDLDACAIKRASGFQMSPGYASDMNCTIRINFKVILLLDISGYLHEGSYAASVLG